MKDKKEKMLTIIGVITLLIFGIGATFAYFIAQGGNAEQTNINVTTHTTDSLVFEVGKAIGITADQTTFAPGAGNRSDNTYARAELKANSSTNNATEHYYVYLAIDTNEFTYSTEEQTAELILTITDPNGNPLTNINGLNYVTVGELSGFDITEEKNLITIANNYEINSTSTKIDEWNITLTLVNLDANQNNNAGKTFNGTLMIQKNAVASQYIASLFTTQGANNLYYHNGTILDSEGNIMDAEDGSYRYAGGDYRVADAYSSTYNSISDIIMFELNDETGYNSLYLTYDDAKTYYNSWKKIVRQAELDGYIVANSVDNYVCFGSNEETCPHDHLYRIIGVYGDNVKLIKADYATEDQLGTDGDFSLTYTTKEEYNNGDSNPFPNIDDLLHKGSNLKYSLYYWNKSNFDLTVNETSHSNVWSYSELNKTNLNKNYLNSIGTKWSNMIDETTWYVGGVRDTSNAKTAYEYELGVNKNITAPYEPYKAKVGLIYVSEYFYSALPNYWTLPSINGEGGFYLDEDSPIFVGTDYTLTMNENWLYMGGYDYSISRIDNNKYKVFAFYAEGSIGDAMAYKYGTNNPLDKGKEIRPTFYLKPTVTFAGGTGTSTDPYRIA